MFRSFTTLACLGFAAITAISTTVHATTTIDTTGSIDNIGVFGEPAAATIGQTFAVDAAGGTLTNLTFFLDDNASFDPDATDFGIYLAAWDTTNLYATGPILFDSGLLTTTNNAGSDGMEQFTVSTGSLALVQGQYIAFLSASRYFDGVDGGSLVGINNNAPYADGTFYVLDNGSDDSQWTSTPWANFYDADLAFIAAFETAAVPEPAVASMLGLAMMGGLVSVRRRRM